MFNLDGIIKVIINNKVIYINESSVNNKNNHVEEKASCIKSSVEERYYIYEDNTKMEDNLHNKWIYKDYK